MKNYVNVNVLKLTVKKVMYLILLYANALNVPQIME
jgi:hypothetical protein